VEEEEGERSDFRSGESVRRSEDGGGHTDPVGELRG
jgi:hypothetical protein